MPGIAERTVDRIGGSGYDTGEDSLHVLSNDILDLDRTYAAIAVTDTETTLFTDDAPTKIVNGVSIKIDLTALGVGDTYDIKKYYRLTSGGAYFEVQDKVTKSDAQTTPIYIMSLDPYRYGVKVTAQRTAGVNRSIPIEAIIES